MDNDGPVLTELKQLAQLVHQVINDNQSIKRTCQEIKLENESLRKENTALKRRLVKISEKLQLGDDEEDILQRQVRVLRTDIPGVSREVDAAGKRIVDLNQQNAALLEENRLLKRRLNLDPNARLPTNFVPRPPLSLTRWQKIKAFFGFPTVV